MIFLKGARTYHKTLQLTSRKFYFPLQLTFEYQNILMISSKEISFVVIYISKNASLLKSKF